MKDKDIKDLYSDKNEVELTDELITKIVSEKKWGDEKSLKEMAEMGARWNTVRDSLVFPMEFL